MGKVFGGSLWLDHRQGYQCGLQQQHKAGFLYGLPIVSRPSPDDSGRFLNGDRRVPVEPVYDQTVFQLLHPALHSIRASALASSIGIGWRLISKC